MSITYPPEMLPSVDEGEEAEVVFCSHSGVCRGHTVPCPLCTHIVPEPMTANTFAPGRSAP